MEADKENREVEMWSFFLSHPSPSDIRLNDLCSLREDAKRWAKLDFSKMSHELDNEMLRASKELLKNKKAILFQLCDAGMREDTSTPYTYYVPTGLNFDCGGIMPVRSLYAIILMARATNTDACWKDCNEEGYPEIYPTYWKEHRVHRVCVFDPFANEIETAIKEYQEDMLKTGKARIVNGIFFKVA